MIRYFWGLFFLYLVVVPVTASAVYYTQYTSSNSLISNNVYNVYRDSRGYMWFATDKGVSRFDGREFKNYTILDGIEDNEVFNFYEDKGHRLWLYTYNGNPCYIRNDSVFNTYNDPLLKKMPVIPFMNAMCSIDDTTLYIGYRFGEMIKLSGSSITWIRRRPSYVDELTSIYNIGKSVYIVTSFIRYTVNEDKITAQNPEGTIVKSNYWNKELLTADCNGIKVYNANKLTWQYAANDMVISNVINMKNDLNGNILVSTYTGLYIVNRATGQKSNLFNGQKISNTAQDIYGNYWVASFGNGIYCINKELDNVKAYSNIQNPKIFSTNNKQSFIIQNNTLYVLSDAPLTAEKLSFELKENIAPLYINDSLFLFSDRDQFYIYNKINREKYSFQFEVKWVYPDNGKYSLISGYFGKIYNLDFINNKPVFIDSCHLNKRIKLSTLNSVDDNIYLLSDDALYRYDRTANKLLVIDSALKDFVIVNMYCVKNNICLLTNTNLLISYNIAGSYKRAEIRTGDLIIFNIIDIDSATYLLNTNKGQYTLCMQQNSTSQFLLKKIEYPFMSSQLFYIYPYGDNLLCNVNGSLYSIDKNLINKELSRPVFYMKKINVNGVPYNTRNITVNNVRNGNVNLQLNSLHFNNSSNNYQYRIHKDDNIGQWYKANGDNLNIPIPEPGSYTIQVRAITENNIVSASEFISVVLNPPFYNKGWFISIVFMLVISGCVYSVYLYNNRRKHVFQNKLNHMKLEHRAINALLNPHFTFNAINNIQDLVNENNSEKANEYLSVFSKLIRQNMENLQFNLVPIDRELTLIENYIHLQNLRFDNKIKLVVSNNLPVQNVVNIPPLLIHTFVENAIVHGFEKDKACFIINIDISISTDDFLIITIRDNGIGFAETKNNYKHLSNKTSMGIDITRKRLERLSQFYKTSYSLDVANITDHGETGTEVIIILSASFKDPVS